MSEVPLLLLRSLPRVRTLLLVWSHAYCLTRLQLGGGGSEMEANLPGLAMVLGRAGTRGARVVASLYNDQERLRLFDIV